MEQLNNENSEDILSGDYIALMHVACTGKIPPQRARHCRGVEKNHPVSRGNEPIETPLELGYYRLLYLAQAPGQ
jgi:hypothetical protein